MLYSSLNLYIYMCREKIFKQRLTGCRNEHFEFKQLPLNQYQQSLGLTLAPSLWRYSHSLPWVKEEKTMRLIKRLNLIEKKKLQSLQTKNLPKLIMQTKANYATENTTISNHIQWQNQYNVMQVKLVIIFV